MASAVRKVKACKLSAVKAMSMRGVAHGAMDNARSHAIAQVVGPTLIALGLTEAMNLEIYSEQSAPVVYLNGTLLFVGGVAIVRSHQIWRWAWPALVTLVGWAALLLGLWRMIAPRAPQLQSHVAIYLVLGLLVVVGGILTVQGYRRAV